MLGSGLVLGCLLWWAFIGGGLGRGAGVGIAAFALFGLLMSGMGPYLAVTGIALAFGAMVAYK